MVTAAYCRAGLTAAEVQYVTNLVAAVEAADPTAPWVAVAREDVLGVVAALDRLVDAAACGAAPELDEDASHRGPASSPASPKVLGLPPAALLRDAP